MDKILQISSTLLPFLAHYPVWVTVLLAVWIVLTVALVAALVLGKTGAGAAKKGKQPQAAPKRSTGTFLVLREVQADPKQFAGPAKVRIQAKVNNQKFDYPAGAKAGWLELGAKMAPVKFALQPMGNSYEVGFTITLLYGEGQTQMVNQGVQEVNRLPFSGEYPVQAFHAEAKTRSGKVAANIGYEIAASK